MTDDTVKPYESHSGRVLTFQLALFGGRALCSCTADQRRQHPTGYIQPAGFTFVCPLSKSPR